MSSSYIPVPVDTTPVNLAGEAFDYLQGKIPGWQPANGNLEAWMIEALALIAGELRELTALVPDAIFGYYGASILGLPPYPAVQATAFTTWKAVDQAGYTINAGTVIAITPAASTAGYGFFVAADTVIPAGTDTLAGVECHALEPGAEASGLTGDVTVIDSLVFISSVTLEGPTSGGQDAETSDAYLSRLSALLTLLSPRPILPQDFAVLAQRQHDGVGRAVAIDLYNPGPPVDANCPRCVTVVVADAAGEPCSPEIKQEVDDLLQSEREVNFLVFVADPVYTTIDVTFDAVCYPSWDPADVQSRIISALTTYLSAGLVGHPARKRHERPLLDQHHERSLPRSHRADQPRRRRPLRQEHDGDRRLGRSDGHRRHRALRRRSAPAPRHDRRHRRGGDRLMPEIARAYSSPPLVAAQAGPGFNPAVPPELEPQPFAARLYLMLGPLGQNDPSYSWSLLTFVNAATLAFEQVEAWVRDTLAGPGWSLLLDADRCPPEALGWLGQFVGVRLLPGRDRAGEPRADQGDRRVPPRHAGSADRRSSGDA